MTAMPSMDLLRNVNDLVHFPAGSTVLAEGDPGKVMYVVRSGQLDVTVGGRLLATVGPGEIVGELALIDAGHRSAAVVAREDSDVVPVDEKRFLFLVQQTPYFAIQVMRTLVERLRRANERAS